MKTRHKGFKIFERILNFLDYKITKRYYNQEGKACVNRM